MPLPLIVSVPGAMTCVYGIYKLINWEKHEIKKVFKDVIDNAGVKVGGAEMPKKPSLEGVHTTPYGFEGVIVIPRGMDADTIEKLKPALEWAYGAEIAMSTDPFKKAIGVKVATSEFVNRDYAPVKAAPHEVFLGFTRFGEPLIVDMNSYPDILVVGSIGSGKSRLQYIILTNLMVQHGCEDVEVYLTQLEKNDLYALSKVRNVQYMADNLKKAKKMFKYLEKEMRRRNATFKKYLQYGVLNIADFNKRYPKKRLPYIYIVGDEFSYYMTNPTDNDATRDLKKECIYLLESLIKAGRSAGLFVMLGLQRPDRNNLPPFIKSQMNCRVSFRAVNKTNAKMILDDDEAVGLPVGECIVETNERFYIKTPNITFDIMQRHLLPYTEKRKAYRDIEEEVKEIPEGPLVGEFIPGDAIQKNMGVVDYVE